jgi:very-short-patch-repair endonuclease
MDATTEHAFHPVRKWRFDFSSPSLRIGIEYQGHSATGQMETAGGHETITGMTRDCEKANAAQAMGWTVLKFTALHFRQKSRKKHKLEAPLQTIRRVAALKIDQ